MKTSEAKLRANKKWQAKNKDKQRAYQYGSVARKFIRDVATVDQLKELQGMIKKRLEEES